MTLTTLRTLVRDITKTNLSSADGGSVSGGDPNLTDAQINQYLSDAAHAMTAEIAKSNDDWAFQGEDSTADLVANQREYVFPTDVLIVSRVEAKFDGTNWIPLRPFAESEKPTIPLADEASIIQRFSNTEGNCYFSTIEKSLFIYSGTIAAVSAGLKLWYKKEVIGKDASNNDITVFATTTDTPNIAAAYQKGLAYYAAQMFFLSYAQIDAAQIWEMQYEKNLARMKEFYGARIEPRFLRMQPANDLKDFE